MNLKVNWSKEYAIFLLILVLTIGVFSFVLFGMAGLRVVLGVIIISSPFYLVLNKFRLSEGEKFVFSVLLGLTIFPSLVYLLGLLISFRIAILVIIIFLLIAACLVNKFYKKN